MSYERHYAKEVKKQNKNNRIAHATCTERPFDLIKSVLKFINLLKDCLVSSGTAFSLLRVCRIFIFLKLAFNSTFRLKCTKLAFNYYLDASGQGGAMRSYICIKNIHALRSSNLDSISFCEKYKNKIPASNLTK